MRSESGSFLDFHNVLVIPPQIRRGSLKGVSTGERVIAKHKNSRFYEAEVIGEREQMFCHVNFYDNSFSENLFPEDIVVRILFLSCRTVTERLF